MMGFIPNEVFHPIGLKNIYKGHDQKKKGQKIKEKIPSLQGGIIRKECHPFIIIGRKICYLKFKKQDLRFS